MKRQVSCLLLISFLVLLFLGFSIHAAAVPAAPDASEIVQPNGTVVKVQLRGDEWKNWVETESGYTIARGRDGYWYYVSRYDGNVPAFHGVKAHQKPPEGLRKHIRPE
jgi:hypothetical protein